MRAKALQSWASHSKRSTAAVTTMDIPPFNPDRDALKTVGARVRRRLARDPAVKPIKTDLAEIYAGPEFLEPDECDRLIEMVDAVAEPSTLYDQTDQQARTSYSGNFDRADPFVQMIERRIDDLLGMPNAWGETIQGQRYQPGQEFRHHCDWFRTDGTYWAQEEATGGQRSWTAMIYLNDVAEGGTTDFYYLDMAIPPRRGAILLWNNVRPDGEPNPNTVHCGTPPVSGVKYVITKWYRTRPWHQLG
jgi:prolyl 4-hydroxylase